MSEVSETLQVKARALAYQMQCDGKHLLNPQFKFRHSFNTDIRDTFRKARKQLNQKAAASK